MRLWFALLLRAVLVAAENPTWIRDGEDGYRRTWTVCPGIFEVNDDQADHTTPFWLSQPTLYEHLSSSKRQPNPDTALVTPLSLERLHALEVQCHQWPGTIAAALYIPLQKDGHTVQFSVYDDDLPSFVRKVLGSHRDLPNVVDRIKGWVDELQEPEHVCRLDVAIYYEQTPELTEWWSYPIQAMRNRALALAQTEVVMIVDGDFVVGPYSYVQRLFSKEGHEQLRQQLGGKKVLVASALETAWGTSEADARHILATTLQHGSKDVLRDLVSKSAQLTQFQPVGHQETDFMRWLNATEVYEVMYNSSDGIAPSWVRTGIQYEPYFFALRDELPSYDERFRGYQWNKLSYTWHLHIAGFRFFVHADAFVLHIHHHRGAGPFEGDWRFGEVERRLYWFNAPGVVREGLGYPRIYVAHPDPNCANDTKRHERELL